MPIRTVAVFAGSSPGRDPAHAVAAEALGGELARRGWRMVYGGGGVGLMGACARACLAAGGEVVGVLPRFMEAFERGQPEGSTLEWVETMHTRKARMADLSDAFVSLPGGLGTLDETFEILTWLQLGLHRCPLGLVDSGGYYAPLLTMLRGMAEEGFVPPEMVNRLIVAPTPAAVLDGFDRWTPPPGPAWPTPPPSVR